MPDITPFDPFAEMRALQRQFFDDMAPGMPGMHVAATDVYMDNNKQMVVEAHLPHFDQDDIAVNVDKGDLEIQAQRHEKEEDKQKKYVLRESRSSFYRRIRLPDQADADNIKASFDKGVLKVIIPLKQLPAPKKIAIDGDKKNKK